MLTAHERPDSERALESRKSSELLLHKYLMSLAASRSLEGEAEGLVPTYLVYESPLEGYVCHYRVWVELAGGFSPPYQVRAVETLHPVRPAGESPWFSYYRGSAGWDVLTRDALDNHLKNIRFSVKARQHLVNYRRLTDTLAEPPQEPAQ